MKRIISIKEYIIGYTIWFLIIIGMFYNESTIYNGTRIIGNINFNYETNIFLANKFYYKITIISYMFVIIEAVILNKRIRRKNLKKIQSYEFMSKLILSIIFISIHATFWFCITKDLFIGVPLLLSSGFFLKMLISNKVCFSDDYFSVDNKLYSIKGLTSIEDDYTSTLGTNFKVKIQGVEYKIRCASSKGKKALMNRLKKYL